MSMTIKCKRIIEGKTYNTETATQITGWSDFNYGGFERGEFLYQSRFGVFFRFSFFDDGSENSHERITPLSPEAARTWLENNAGYNPALIDALFGEMPEAGSGEVKYTLRMPESLRNRLNEKAKENNQSLNAWIIRCLERCSVKERANV
jgi:HicB family